MQKTQNADTQRVINLVDYYRTKVKESDAAKDAQMEYEDYYEFGVDQTQTPNDAQWEWVKFLSVNEQLLGHFYSLVAGDEAEMDILQQLLPEAYDTSIFTQEEEDFLKAHFKELVNYIIQTPDNVWSTKYGDNSEGRETFLIPEEVLELIKSRANVPDNAVIYNPFAWLGQLATLFKSNTVLWGDDCDLYGHMLKLADSIHNRDTIFHQRMLAWMKSWVWARVAMYANNVNAQIMEKDSFGYDVLITSILVPYLPYGDNFIDKVLRRILEAYNHLKEGGKMVLLCPSNLLSSTNAVETLFRKQLVKDGSVSEIILLPSVMSSELYHRQWCLMIIEKGHLEKTTTLIDAQLASISCKNVYTEDDIKNTNDDISGTKFLTANIDGNLKFMKIDGAPNFIMNLKWLNAMIENGGIDPHSGLRQMVKIPSNNLTFNTLMPQFYIVERPSEEMHPTRLSSVCQMILRQVRNVPFDLPMDTPWITTRDLSYIYHGALDMTSVQVANCPNNPPHTDEYDFDAFGKFIEDDAHYLFEKASSKGYRVVNYRDCTYHDGVKDLVLCEQTVDGVKIALVPATGNPIAIDSGIDAFVPNDNVDATSLMAILQMPIVYRQVQVYKQIGLWRNLGDILIPTNKRIIMDEIMRLKKEEKSYKDQKEKFDSMKTEYINEVRMRKHDMGQYVFELINIEDLMRYYMENRDKEKDFCQQIEGLLDNFKASIGELSTLLDNLSKEEEFGEPERFDLHEFLSHLEERHKTEGYVIKYECDMKSIIDFNSHRQEEIDDYLLKQEEEDARAQQKIDDYLLDQEIEDARAQQEIDDYLLEQEEEDARIQQEIEDSLWEDEAYVFDETQASDDESYMVDETSNVTDEAHVFEETQSHDDNSYVVGDTLGNDEAYVLEESQAHDEEPYVIDGLWGKYLSTIPSLYVAPNDIQRLVNNILDNARKHGFTDHKHSDYEVDVRLSINTETQMFQIDFRNNGNPLPEGMDKTRYGIKGEKAGATGGTGIGGSYVKKCVEHYGGDYNIFTEDGWTVVRICLPIK